MFPFFNKSNYSFPKIQLTSPYAKEAIKREIEYLESRVDAIARIKKEQQLRNA